MQTRPSLISTVTFNSGDTGNIILSARTLSVLSGGALLSPNFGTGKGGDITVNASDFVKVIGYNPKTFQASVLAATAFRDGNAGNLTINTSNLSIHNGGRVDTATLARGNAGNLNINASNSIDVSGTLPNSFYSSSLDSSADILEKSLQQLYGLPPIPSGSAGNVIIGTKKFNVTDGAKVSVRNVGAGNAGNIVINANSINLNNGGSITAAAASGEGGNIFLRSQNLQLRNGSKITTDATGGSGNGGSININTDLLTLTQASKITADAVAGRGGNIDIATQGLFQSPDSPITASSQLGIDGRVQINTLINQPTEGTLELPQEVIDSSRLIAQGCPGNVGQNASSFIITGRGGLPEDPYAPLNAEAPIWVDLRPIASNRHQQNKPTNNQDMLPQSRIRDSIDLEPKPLIAANSWQYNSKGEIVLFASNKSVPLLPSLECQALK